LAVDRLRKMRHILPPSGIERWLILRKFIQGAAFVIFLALLILSRRSAAAPDLINLPLRLDPLVVVASLFSSKSFLAGSSAALFILLLTLLAGRAWCGWLCPMGTLLDLFSGNHRKNAPVTVSESLRTVKHGLLLSILIMALFGSLSLLIFDPLTILYRSFTLAVLPALDQAVSAVLAALYPVPFLSRAVIQIDGWLRPAILPTIPLYYQDAFVFGAILVGVILLNHLASRFWCRYLCPLGGLLGWISKISLFRRRVDADCRACGVCERACPTGTIDPARGYASDPAECTLCLECFKSCPRSTIDLAAHFRPSPGYPYDPGRRHALAALGFSAAAVTLFRRDSSVKYRNKFLLRPPGAVEETLMRTCVRCGACIAACPTGALQPAINEVGLEGLWTPVILPRLGYCHYGCSACGQVCPVEAIPPLRLEEKRQQVIGKAYIDQNRCLAWSNLEHCIICEEMCPIPSKAIHLERTEIIREEGEVVTVLLPYVERQFCIGCGICENKCPVGGESAIRVYLNDQNS